MDVRVLSAFDVARALPMDLAIEGMKEAFAQLSAGEVDMPLRGQLSMPKRGGLGLVMPAYLSSSGDLAVKIVTVYPDNPAMGKPAINAAVMVFDSSDGSLMALLEGASLTAIRTGAASGAATDLLARPDAKTVAILGSGVQARTQLEAVCTVRAIERVLVYSPNQDHARAFAQEMAGQDPIPHNIQVAANPAEAVIEADIICAATNAERPVFDGRHVRAGTHINAVGSFRPTMQEVDFTTLIRSLIVVDSLEAVLEEAGELIIALESGAIVRDHIHAELGQIIAGKKDGRNSSEQITFFKSVGLAVQDAVAGRIALHRAASLGLGQVVAL